MCASACITVLVWPESGRGAKSLEALIPIPYLKGISTGDFEEALAALLGPDAGSLSALTAARRKDAGADEKSWRRLDGHKRLPKVLQGVKFVDGIEAIR